MISKKYMLLIILMMSLAVIGCSKDPVNGTWQGRLILTNTVQQTTDTSNLRLELRRGGPDGVVLSGKFTASEFGWQNLEIKYGSVYSPTHKGVAIYVDVGGEADQLSLVGFIADNSMSGDASALFRTGTWDATRK